MAYLFKTFVALVDGCPLALQGGKHVKQVTVKIGAVENNPNLIKVQWHFEMLMNPLPFIWSIPMYVEQSDLHFGRGGRAIDEGFDAKLVELGYVFERS